MSLSSEVCIFAGRQAGMGAWGFLSNIISDFMAFGRMLLECKFICWPFLPCPQDMISHRLSFCTVLIISAICCLQTGVLMGGYNSCLGLICLLLKELCPSPYFTTDCLGTYGFNWSAGPLGTATLWGDIYDLGVRVGIQNIEPASLLADLQLRHVTWVLAHQFANLGSFHMGFFEGQVWKTRRCCRRNMWSVVRTVDGCWNVFIWSQMLYHRNPTQALNIHHSVFRLYPE